MKTQNELKKAVAHAALDYVSPGTVIGIGTGSTVNFFIDALAGRFGKGFSGAVSSSEATRARLEGHGIRVLDLNEVSSLSVYIDGADEITPDLCMIKGGGGALTREKIIAAVAKKFVCIADASKLAPRLGCFPLPLEVLPMARKHVERELARLGGAASLRGNFVTDNGNLILDVRDLQITNPRELETRLNQIAGIVCNGLFALRGADVLLLGEEDGVSVRTPQESA